MPVRNIVRPARHIAAGFGVDRSVERVSADLIKDLDLACDNGTVPFHSGFDFYHRAVTSTREKHFVPVQHPLHGTSRLAREQGNSGLQPRVSLAPVTTT